MPQSSNAVTLNLFQGLIFKSIQTRYEILKQVQNDTDLVAALPCCVLHDKSINAVKFDIWKSIDDKIMNSSDSRNKEIDSLIDAIYKKYGYDFTNYSKASVRRRILFRFSKEKFETISEMKDRVIKDVHFFNKLLLDLSVNTTEMFREPSFHKAVRTHVIPILKTYPSIKVWHAGCSSGEEVYSMAILLKEENMYDKATIYATDFNQIILKKAEGRDFSYEQYETEYF